MIARRSTRPWLRSACVLATTLTISALPAFSADRLKELQTQNVATAKKKMERAYHFGSQGPGSFFSNHASHSNRLIPFYVFGSKGGTDQFTGSNSPYRDPEKVKALYGFLPPNTVNPEADYADQSNFYEIQRQALKKGVKHLFIVWFDGLDWPTTQAAAIAKTGKIYTEGKGSGLIFQDYEANGSSRFGYYVTSPTRDKNSPDMDAQTVTFPPTSLAGGYDVQIAGPNPWTLGPLGPKAPGYLKGQSGNDADKEGVKAVNRLMHAYTDSSTSAAELASGVKAYNNGVNVADDGRFVPTLFNQIQQEGWKVGTVTSVPFNHASPSAMYAHNVYRNDYQDLGREMLGLPSIVQETKKGPQLPGLDVVMGTGFGQNLPASGAVKAQGKNAVAGNLHLTDADKAAIDVKNGGKYVVVQTDAGKSGGEQLKKAAAEAAANGHRLFAFYGNKGLNHLPFQTTDGQFDPAPDLGGKAEVYTPEDLKEQPTLAQMTESALTVMTAKPDQKFALFVEAGDVDFGLHKNNLDNAIGAVYSGEDAIKTIIKWVETHSNWDDSLMIVSADHGHYMVIDDLKALAPVKP